MTTACPKCRHVRQANETVPDWQCPACGVAYNKVMDMGGSNISVRAQVSRKPEKKGFPWFSFILLLVLAWGGWTGAHILSKKFNGILGEENISSEVPSESDIPALAASVTSGEIVMYSTTECGYCAQAKAWLESRQFAFSDCNMSISNQCEQEFRNLGGNGVPYLVVRGHHMKDGFNQDEFLLAVRDGQK